MTNRYRLVVMIIALAALVVLPACGANATPAQPTIDPNTIYTQAVQTVQAGLTQTAVAAPTDTPTPEPTATLEPTATPEPPTPTISSTQPTLASIATQPPAPASSGGCQTGQTGDKACYGSQSPKDNSHFNGMMKVQVFFSLVNVGSATWTKSNYKLVFIGGTQLSGQTTIALDKDTPPGKKAEFYTNLITPTKDGKYTSYWALFNGNQRVPGGEVYLSFIIP